MNKILVFVLLLFHLIIINKNYAQSSKADSLLILYNNESQDSLKFKYSYKLTRHYYNTGLFDKALQQGDSSLFLCQKLKDKKAQVKVLNLIGNIYWKKSDYVSALNKIYEALKIAEKENDLLGIADSYNYIGLVYWNMDKLDEALNKYRKSEEYFNLVSKQESLKIEAIDGLAGVYNNIGIIYWLKGELEIALPYFEKAVEQNLVSGNKNWLSNNYNNIAGIYSEMNRYDLSIPMHIKTLELRTQLDDKEGIATSLINLGTEYFQIKKDKIAKQYFLDALNISKEISGIEDLKYVYEGLYKVDSALNNFSSSLEYYKLFIQYRDSIFKDENEKAAIEQELQYEFEKKEATIKAEQEKKDAVAKAEKQRQQLFIILIAAVAIAISVIALLVYRSLAFTKKQKLMIEHQKYLVEEKQKEILDSIHYAKRIQMALLTNEFYIEKHINKLKKS
jgi:tetratricopeptide (TPR) repeat protein